MYYRKMSEDTLQEQCVRWFDCQYCSFRQMLFHIPNGGKRNLKEAEKFKRMGVRAGVADLFLSIASNGYHGLYVEMKFGKNKQTENQKEFERQVTENGYLYRVCYSFEEFMEIIEKYLS